MSSLRQVGLGVLAALFSTALIFGSMLLALMEGGDLLAMAPAPTLTETPVATPKPGEPTFTPTLPPPPTVTPTAAKPVCENAPPDWVEHDMLPGETLSTLAQQYGIPLETLLSNNCLDLPDPPDFSMFVVPPATIQPTETPTPTQPPPTATTKKKEPTRVVARCSRHPSGWVSYKVRRNDTLSGIARSFGTTVSRLMAANCLSSSNIRTGQSIYVPGSPPKAPKRSATPVPRSPRRTSIPPTRRAIAPPARPLSEPPIEPPTQPPPAH